MVVLSVDIQKEWWPTKGAIGLRKKAIKGRTADFVRESMKLNGMKQCWLMEVEEWPRHTLNILQMNFY